MAAAAQKKRTEIGDRRANNMESIRPRRRGTMSYTTNSSMLRSISAGSEEAWCEFHRKYVGMVHAVGRKRRLTKEECDDLMVTVMVTFWKKLDTFVYDRQRGKFRSYLAKIADFSAQKIYRNSHLDKGDILHTQLVDYPEGIDSVHMEEWKNFVIEQALEELQKTIDTETYQVFYMYFVQKRPVADIAEFTRKTPNNIYAINSRCRKKIKAIIAAYRAEFEASGEGNSPRSSVEY